MFDYNQKNSLFKTKVKTVLSKWRLLFLAVVLTGMGHVIIHAATITVSTTAGFESALATIGGNNDIDNVIIIGSSANLTIDSSVDWTTNITKDKRITVRTIGNSSVVFSDTDIPNHVTLVIDSPTATFADTFNIKSNIEIRKSGTTNTIVTSGNSQNIIIGGIAGNQGTLGVAGNGAKLIGQNNLIVGDGGEGTLNITSGATAEAKNIYLGRTTGGHGDVNVTGIGSKLTVNTAVAASGVTAGTGSLNVTNEGTLELLGHGEVVLDGQVLFDDAYLTQQSGSLLNANTGNIIFGGHSIVSSAGTLKANDVFVNDQSILGVAGSNSVLNIDGGLYLNPGSTVNISLSGANSGRINVDNGPVALGGTLLITPEYGNYGTTPSTYTIITADNNTTTGNVISGAFSDYLLPQSRLGTLTLDPSSNTGQIVVQFNPNVAPFRSITQTYNQRNVGQTFDTIHQTQLPAFQSFMQQAWGLSDAQLLRMYDDLSGEIRAATMTMVNTNPARRSFDRVGWDSQYGHVFFGPQYRLAARGSRGALWLQPYYNQGKVHHDSNALGYEIEAYGFSGGVDHTLRGGKTAIGAMIGYGRPELHQDDDKAELDDFVVGGYLATKIPSSLEIKLWGGYGYQYYDMNRQINYFGTVQHLRSNFKGNTGTASAEITLPIYTGTRLVLRPVVGYDYLYLKQKEGGESGNSVVGLSFDQTEIKRHVGRAGINLEYGRRTYSFYGGMHYKYLLAGDDYYYSQASFLGGGPSFQVRSVDLGKSFYSGNIGMQINLSDDRSRMIFGDYTADFGKNDTFLQTATLGFQQTY